MKNNKFLRVIAGLIAVALIIVLLIFTNAFVGNPISAAIAKNAASKHIERNYGSLNLKQDKPIYNFKFNEYIIKAYSETSIDTHFSIYYSRGKIRDDYESSVGDKFNTFMRLGDEYSKLIKEIVSDKLGYKDNNSWVIYNKDEYEKYKDIIELDMAFEKKLPLEAEVMLDIKSDDLKIEKIIEILEEAHQIFLKENCIFDKYSTSIEGKDIMYNISGLTPGQIEDGNLLEIINKAMENKDGEYEGVSVFIKE